MNLIDAPFGYDLQKLQRAKEVILAWQQFFSPARIEAFTALGADRCQGLDNYNRDEAWIELKTDSKSAMTALRAMLLPHCRDREMLFQRSNLNDARAWVHLPLQCFGDFAPKDCELSARFSITEHITFAPTSFRLQHQKRKGMRWARLYCTDYRLAYRDRQVAEEDFPEKFGREEMFARLLDALAKGAISGQYSISFEPLIGEIIRANAPTPYDGFCYEI